MIKKQTVLLFCFFWALLINCSTQPPQVILNTPLALSGSQKADNTIDLIFYGYNPEKNFSGYNIYVMVGGLCTNTITWSVFNSNLAGTDIPSTQGGSGKPSFPPSLFPAGTTPGITYGTTLLAYNLRWDASSTPVDLTSNDYCVGVKAIDLGDAVESKLSNVIYCQNGSDCVNKP